MPKKSSSAKLISKICMICYNFSFIGARTSSQSAEQDREDYANQKMASKEAEIDKLKVQAKSMLKSFAQLEENLERFRANNEQLENEASIIIYWIYISLVFLSFFLFFFLTDFEAGKLRLKAAALLGLQDAHHMLQVQHEEYVALLDEARAKISFAFPIHYYRWNITLIHTTYLF
jgi:hypothetical protein